MWPATTWDDQDWQGNQARGWAVMGRVRGNQQALRRAKHEAQRRIAADADADRMQMMTPALLEQAYHHRLTAGWRGSTTVLAFLFAMPDEPTMTMLNRRGAYFDIRSGNTWDLFFPGYYRSDDQGLENHVLGTRPVGDQYANDWFFNERDFDLMRQHVEDSTGQRWQYSGGSDLILVNAYVPEWGEPTVDWESIQSGVIHPPETLAASLSGLQGT